MNIAEKLLHARMARLSVSNRIETQDTTIELTIRESGTWRIILGKEVSLTPVQPGRVESDCEIVLSFTDLELLDSHLVTPQELFMNDTLTTRGDFDSARYFCTHFWRDIEND